ncbi:MAG: ATP-binding protein [Deltaproteobacteria bacterium]|nr:ATP-binding protein [Candidatus Anaeroferrophillacea bacterium]
MKKLPIGIQTFRVMREADYCYVDKTPFIVRLVNEGRYYFMARPRRFGKSLFIDTMAEAFAGTRELFTGLYLERHWDWETRSPVLRLDFSGGVLRRQEELDEAVLSRFSETAEQYGIELNLEKSLHLVFSDLVKAIYESTGRRVVILVDEYDKPILDNLTDSDRARELRDGLRNIYSVIKAQDACIHFVFLTGVSKLSKVSIFSGLNNLKDITLDRRYGSFCGYPETDLDEAFGEHLAGVDRDRLRHWYNGYNFLGESVYNPFDILLFLDNREYGNYWFETGSPTFLIDLLAKRRVNLAELEHLTAGDTLLGSFDVGLMEPETILFQTGYLTIQSVERLMDQDMLYHLGFPNHEVRKSLADSMLGFCTRGAGAGTSSQNRLILLRILEKNDLDGLRDLFHAFFASIPHDWYRKNEITAYEGFYASVVYCYFAALGLDVTPEDTTNKGRIDMTVHFAGRVYICEFKVNETGGPGTAIAQLKKRKYHEKFMGPAKVGGVDTGMGASGLPGVTGGTASGSPTGRMGGTARVVTGNTAAGRTGGAADDAPPGAATPGIAPGAAPGPETAGGFPAVYLVAVEFSRAERNITAFSWEQV